MKFLDLVKARQSVREYLSKEVERDKIERCLEAARLAPSANN
ncbi:MAG: nitroreductase family protein, partial [Atribacterota bacterium]